MEKWSTRIVARDTGCEVTHVEMWWPRWVSFQNCSSMGKWTFQTDCDTYHRPWGPPWRCVYQNILGIFFKILSMGRQFIQMDHAMWHGLWSRSWRRERWSTWLTRVFKPSLCPNLPFLTLFSLSFLMHLFSLSRPISHNHQNFYLFYHD